jgi:single-strand DNA-binding protein
MASLNKVMIIGNLGKDPDIRTTTTGQTVASFSVATSEKFKNKNGEMEERTEWHNVVLWGKQAEVARDYLHKGKSVYVEGRLQTRKWENKEGQTRYSTEVIGDRMQMLSSKKDNEDKGYPSSWDEDRGENKDLAEFANSQVLDDIPF